MKRKIIFPILIVALISGLILYSNITSRIVYNDDMMTGNTPGNLMNGGCYCEKGNTIYFSNLKDYERLYSMDLNCKKFKKIVNNTVSNISCAGKYIYYVGQSNKYKQAKSGGAALSSGGIGLYRCDLRGKNTQTLYDQAVGTASLSGNFIYYQHYDKNKGVHMYKVKIDEKEGQCLFKSPVNPIGIYNGNLYFAGAKQDHNIYKMSLLSDSYDSIYQGNCASVLVFQNKIYFLDLDNNYALTSINLDGSNPEVIINKRVLTYNFSLNGNYMYYQIDNQEESCICQMDMKTMKQNILLKGSFNSICTTSKYVFFREYNSNNEYVIEDKANPRLNLFKPPIKK